MRPPGNETRGPLERLESWFYTGPVGRITAFVADFGDAWLRWARGRDPSTRPERPPDKVARR